MPERVLIVVENLPVPFDTRVWNEARALRDAGYEVHVVCPAGKGFPRGHDLHEGVHIYRHPLPPERNGALGYLLEYGVALAWEFWLAWRLFLRRRFRVLQGCNPPDDIFLLALTLRPFGVRYIFDHHDVNPELYEAKYGRRGLLWRLMVWLERLTFKTAHVVMSTNQTYRGIAMARGGLPPDRVFVVRNGPDPERFRPRPPRPELKHGKPYLVGYVGTMSMQEGLDILLQVARRCRDLGRDDVHFTCVGGGPGLKDLQRLRDELGLQETVTFTGRIPEEELLAILSTADVCVNPDRPSEMNDMSTMIKIMEYMALARPIVQFDLQEGRFSAQEAALYADRERPVEDFAAKILHLLDHPEERERRGAFGRRRVEQELAWRYSVPPLLAAYERALKG